MRRLKRLLKWSILPLIFELSMLFYFDKIYLSQNLNFKINKESRNGSKVNLASIKTKVPEDNSSLKVSYDGKYVSYMSSDVLKIINTQDNSENTVKFPSDIKATYYTWLPDRDRLLIAEKNGSGSRYYYTISYYDTREKERVQLSDDSGKAIKISVADSKYEVDSIAMSTLTNATYIKVTRGGNKNNIYRIDANSHLENFMNSNYKLGTIATLNRDDKFIYEDLTHKKVTIVGKKTVNISDIINPYILGIDNEDNMYIGSTKENKVTTIFYKKMDTVSRNWETIRLQESKEKDSIHITGDGSIYIDDSLKGMLTEVKSGKTVNYNGKFLQLVKGGVISNVDGKIQGKSL